MIHRIPVGGIVHYVSHGSPVQADGSQRYRSVCRAAVVTAIEHSKGGTPVLGLAVLNPTGLFFDPAVPPGLFGGMWHPADGCPQPDYAVIES